MKVTYFSKYSEKGPSSRYRIYQFRKHFLKAGVALEIYPLFEDQYLDNILRKRAGIAAKSIYASRRFIQRLSDLRKNEAPLTIIEHQLFPYLPYLFEKPFLPENHLIEFDDAIYLTHPTKMPSLLSGAAGVIVGNSRLAEYAGRHNSKIHVIPTVIDTDLFIPPQKVSKRTPTIGWIGLEYNFRFLRMLSPVFQKLAPSVQILIISGSSPGDLGYPYRFEKWDPSSETRQLGAIDIGVMPLGFDEWSAAKCGFKLLQYMSLAIPSVATPVGVNAEIISEGENAFAASNLDEWESRLRTLIEQPDLRQRIGTAARATVEERYSIRRWFPELLRVYQEYGHPEGFVETKM